MPVLSLSSALHVKTVINCSLENTCRSKFVISPCCYAEDGLKKCPGGLPYKKIKRGGGTLYLLGIKQGDLVPPGVFSLEESIAGAFAVPFRMSSQKNATGNKV